MVVWAACWVACGGRVASQGEGYDVPRGGTYSARDAGRAAAAEADGVGTGGSAAAGSGGIGTGGSAGAGAGDVGGSDGSSDKADAAVTSDGTWKLTNVLSGAPWDLVQTVAGMAVDDRGRVYLADAKNIYVVDGRAVSVYLTLDEAISTAGITDGLFDDYLEDLDFGPDGELYILLAGHVVRSSVPHQARLWRGLPTLSYPHRLAVVGAGHVSIVDDNGFWNVTKDSASLVYTKAQIHSERGCAVEDLSAAPSGVFLYQAGCNAWPIVRGKADGSGVGILYETDLFNSSPIHAKNFLCSARDPSGGFYLVVDDAVDNRLGSHLYHVAESSDAPTPLVSIEPVPSFYEAEQSQSEDFAFWYCSLAVGKDGTVFYQTRSQLWKVTRRD
jgi:hypothetical protein